MKSKITILVTCFILFISCKDQVSSAQEKQTNPILLNLKNSNQMIDPYYLVDFNSSICNFEIYINDMPAFIHDEGGSIASHYPINHFILGSGQQNIKLKVLPLKGETNLREDAFLKIKVHFYDSATNNYDALTEVFKFETPDLSKPNLPIIELDAKFIAEVPYKIKGWKESLVFKDVVNIKDSIISFYNQIHQYMKLEDVDNLSRLMKTRFNEMDTSMYIRGADNKNELKDLFKNIKSGELVLEDFPKYPKIIIYGDGKVINVVREDNNPIIHYVNKKTNEEFSLPLFIHKKAKDLDFEIIR